MTTKATVEGFLTAVMERTDWVSYLGENLVFISATSPLKEVSGKEAALPGLRRFYSMVSAMQIRELIVEGQRACALTRYTLQPPGGRAPFQSDVAEIFNVRDDRITSFAIYFDTAPYPK
jgi:ketosteroid isomerase-like protein